MPPLCGSIEKLAGEEKRPEKLRLQRSGVGVAFRLLIRAGTDTGSAQKPQKPQTELKCLVSMQRP